MYSYQCHITVEVSVELTSPDFQHFLNLGDGLCFSFSLSLAMRHRPTIDSFGLVEV
jgi:hypothetical protein